MLFLSGKGEDMKKNSGRVLAVLQKVGTSLMLPVSVLPAAGLMVALSRVLEQLAGPALATENPALATFITILFQSGMMVLENLPLIFAIGVAIGFTGGEAVSGLAAAVGYLVLVRVLAIMSEALMLEEVLNMGVFSGILMGMLSAAVYRRYARTKLNPILGFFEGKRLVPILMVFLASGLGVLLGFVWSPVQEGIHLLGQQAIHVEVFGVRLGGAIYALGNRALIPTGLHHVFKTPFTTQFGTYVAPSGEVFVGEIARFFAGDPTAGTITAAEYPLKIFGLPAAALAMVMTAKPQNRRAIGGIMLSASLTSIITGITEPLEFSFMFVAPVLYVAHILLAFVGGLLMSLFHVRLTETFTSSLIDYLVSISTGNAGNPLMLIPVGLVMFAAYFLVFYGLIRRMDLSTPGRKDGSSAKARIFISRRAYAVFLALGGEENIQHVDACITRLRLQLSDNGRVDKRRLKELGSAGIMETGAKSLQIIFSTDAEGLKDDIKALLTHPPEQLDIEGEGRGRTEPDHVKAPAKGRLLALEDVPDALFAEKMIGDGFALDPEEGTVVAPVKGTILHIFETNHAIAMRTPSGLDILVHIGIDTVKLSGEGFTRMVSIGDAVESGATLVKVDLGHVKRTAKSAVIAVVVTNMDAVKRLEVHTSGRVEAGTEVMKVW